MCGFVERFHTCVVKIKQEIKNQKILSFSSLRNSVPPDESRKLDEVKFDVLIHDPIYSILLLKMPILRI